MLKLPSVTQNASYSPGLNRVEVKEFSPTSANVPSSAWYHIFTTEGADAAYNTQLALGMTEETVYYRNKINNTWGSWRKVYSPWKLIGAVSDTTVLSIPAGTSEICVEYWLNGDRQYCNAVTIPFVALPTSMGNALTYRIRIGDATVAFYAWSGYVQIANKGGFSDARMALYCR